MAKKSKHEPSYEEIYEEIFEQLKNKSIPALTLNKKWHDIFPEGKPKEVEIIEKELNDALKEQGKINSEKKELNDLKQTLMKKILDNMETNENSREEKQVQKCRELIEDINDKLILAEDRELGLPKEIREVNARLMMESMNVLCEKTMQNKDDITELDSLIENARIELKKKVLLRQQKMSENEAILNFLNDSVGSKIVGKYEYMLRKKKE